MSLQQGYHEIATLKAHLIKSKGMHASLATACRTHWT